MSSDAYGLPTPQKTYVQESSLHELGVFVSKTVQPDELVEVCPYRSFIDLCPDHLLRDGRGTGHLLTPDDQELERRHRPGAHLPAGHALLYNHADEPNAYLAHGIPDKLLRVVASKRITTHQEVTLDYAATNPSGTLGFG